MDSPCIEEDNDEKEVIETIIGIVGWVGIAVLAFISVM